MYIGLDEEKQQAEMTGAIKKNVALGHLLRWRIKLPARPFICALLSLLSYEQTQVSSPRISLPIQSPQAGQNLYMLLFSLDNISTPFHHGRGIEIV